MNNFLKAYSIKQVLSVHALIVFRIVCFLVDEIIVLKVELASLKLLTNLKILSVTLCKDPKAAIDT